ncbi:hypothetical protein JOB18_025324 [Solea senegalensis]|uniref:Uncharacterized protein n=1 Tax=Solea senegalensis TaxID=28829 RepID=A0AAV6PT21_SOLSE|nr:hypothetical protein JOB18_025324 [Solea senegalensis]
MYESIVVTGWIPASTKGLSVWRLNALVGFRPQSKIIQRKCGSQQLTGVRESNVHASRLIVAAAWAPSSTDTNAPMDAIVIFPEAFGAQ